MTLASIKRLTTIWCTFKDDVYTPLSTNYPYTPDDDLVKGLEAIGYKVVRCNANIAIEILSQITSTDSD